MAAIAGAGLAGGLRVNLTPSYPRGLWRIEPLDREPTRGDLVFICPPDNSVFERAFARGYIRRGLCAGGLSPLIKTVVGVAGETVSIGERVSINGRTLPASDVRQTDAAGRSLSPFAGGVIPAGDLFLHSDFAGSYDSRYFGPLPSAGVLGLARPLLTFRP
ncbi:conjugative transfer signal peptidase TraF [Bradyrhizobium sp.]|uniref:conjugative transfer signal peptidase TraF n=1 Tax=Bradyrhizobium sp. TaxID=376 RepID=UPI0039E72943